MSYRVNNYGNKILSTKLQRVFSKSFLRNLVRDRPYSYVLEDRVSSTISPPSPVSFCEFGNDTLCCVLDRRQLVTINSCSMFRYYYWLFLSLDLGNTKSWKKTSFQLSDHKQLKILYRDWRITRMMDQRYEVKIIIIECHLLFFFKTNPNERKTFFSIYLLMLPLLP